MYISYSFCAKAMTNEFFKCISILSSILKGKWSIRRRQGFHSTLTVLFTLHRHSTNLSIGITYHSYFFTNGGESIKGLSKSPFLAINAKGGESIKPKAKGPHHHHFKKIRNKVLIDAF
jgi:hypothetical protein